MEFNIVLKNVITIVTLLAIAITLVVVLDINYPLLNFSVTETSSTEIEVSYVEADVNKIVGQEDYCDIFTGEWIPNPDAPYYTNFSCGVIQEEQNCMKYGRPDTEFLKWRWKPDECELPIFDPAQFFELVRGKYMAFIGDSVARNHMQSLICLLSRVEYPLELSKPDDGHGNNKFYTYKEHDFNLSMSWSPYLVKHQQVDKNMFHLYLDEPDPVWINRIKGADYVVISAGQWFLRPSYFYVNKNLVGGLYCPESNITHMSYFFSYRMAFQSAFRAIKDGTADFNGVTFLRTYVPSHFEGAPFDKGGDCVRTRPFKRNETVLLEEYHKQFRMIQLEELKNAYDVWGRNNGTFKVIDAMNAMRLRPDGHPSKYGHPSSKTFLINDCVHWCLPGPIDLWNDFLQELLMRELNS